MANFYDDIVSGIKTPAQYTQERALRQEQLRRIQMEKDALAKQKAMEGQRQNILQQYFQPAVPERQELEAVGNPLAQFMGEQPQQQYQNLVAATPKPVNNLVERQTNVQPQGGVIPETQMKTIPGKEAVFDPRGAMGALFGVGDIETGKQMAGVARDMTPEQAKWLGVLSEGINDEGQPTMLGMTTAGPQVIPGFRPKPKPLEAPKTREFERGGKKITQEWRDGKYVDIAEAPRTIEKPKAPMSPEDSTKLTIQLRNGYVRETQAFREVRQARDNVKNSLGQNTASGDLAAATAIMKMLDPGSVVRESELALAMNATGSLDKLGNYAQMVQNGQRLNPTQRKEMDSLANQLFSTAEGYNNQVKDTYQGLATDAGLNPERVLGSQPKPAAPKPAPKAVDLLPRNAKEGSIARDATTGKPAWVVKNGKWVRYK